MSFDPFRIFLTLLAVVIAITIHEFAHAMSAVRAGDDTPRLQGRISLNPVDHFDPVGFLMILFTSIAGFGIGWGKPVQINPYNFRNPRKDDIMVSFWGPLSNLLLATAVALVLRFGGGYFGYNVWLFLVILVITNIGLALFNLIPLPPLDGSHILSGLLPPEQARAYGRFAAQYGMAVLLIILVLPPGEPLISLLLHWPRQMITNLLLGRMFF